MNFQIGAIVKNIVILLIFIALIGCYNPTVTSFKIVPESCHALSVGVSGMTNIEDSKFEEDSSPDTLFPDMFFPDNLGYRKTKGVSLGYRRGLGRNQHAGADFHFLHFGRDENNLNDFYKFAISGTFQKNFSQYSGFSPNIGILFMNNPSMFEWDTDNGDFIWAFLGSFGFTFSCKFFAGIPIKGDFLGFAGELSWMSAKSGNLFGNYMYVFYDKQVVNNTLNFSIGIDPWSLTATARLNYMYSFHPQKNKKR